MTDELEPEAGRAVGFNEMYTRGRETFAALVPGGRERLDKIFALAPDLAQAAVGTVYGHLHHRATLDPRTREVAALAAIIASGMCGTPLAVHVRTALAAGLAPAEIVEVVLECAAFSGMPRAVSSLPAIEEAFGQAGISCPPPPSPRDTVFKETDAARHQMAARRTETNSMSWATPLCRPGSDATVHAIDRDQALVVVMPNGSKSPERVLHVRVEGDQVVEVSQLLRANDVPESEPAAAGATLSARQALAALLEDLRAVGHGPAAGLVITDPDLLDQAAPLHDVLANGIRPQVSAIDARTAVAVFRDTRIPHPVVALAFADNTGRIHHIHVVEPTQTPCES